MQKPTEPEILGIEKDNGCGDQGDKEGEAVGYTQWIE